MSEHRNADPKDYARQESGTPRLLFARLHHEYGFTIDVCACEYNTKLPRYWNVDDDALSKSWEGERAWCNPVYHDIPPWLDKSVEAEFSAYLLPMRADRLWWMKWKPLAECHYFVGEKPYRRLQFEPPPGVVYSSNPAANVLLLFGDGCVPGLEVWRSGINGKIL